MAEILKLKKNLNTRMHFQPPQLLQLSPSLETAPNGNDCQQNRRDEENKK